LRKEDKQTAKRDRQVIRKMSKQQRETDGMRKEDEQTARRDRQEENGR
jgi:hypothetical protein